METECLNLIKTRIQKDAGFAIAYFSLRTDADSGADYNPNETVGNF